MNVHNFNEKFGGWCYRGCCPFRWDLPAMEGGRGAAVEGKTMHCRLGFMFRRLLENRVLFVAIGQGFTDSESSGSSGSSGAITSSCVCLVVMRIFTRSATICNESNSGFTLEAVQFSHFIGTSAMQ